MPTQASTAQLPFLDAYLAGELSEAFPWRPAQLDAALAQPRTVDRSGLAAALGASQQRWGMRPAQREALRRLAHPESTVVVTGQQIGWLLGPSYTLSKAATALRLAAQLHQEDRPVVAVFWMATQDHDVAEVDHAWLLGRDERLHASRLALPEGPAVGRAGLAPGWLERVLQELRAADSVRGRPGPHLDEVAALLQEAADGAPRWTDAFARIMCSLLGDQGLLLLDPLDAEVARLWRPLLERELDDPEVSVDQLRAAGKRLDERGYAPQLGRGEGATNLFVERPGGGPRELLRVQGGGFLLGDRAVGKEELLAMLDEDPSSVTPAAGLRPVTQDLVLPSAVFVVGPGELRYLAQLRGVYEHHGVPMPLVWPRASATVLQPPVRRILERHGLDWRQVQRDPETALCELALQRHGHGDAFNAALSLIDQQGAALFELAVAIDPTLERPVRKGRYHFERTVLTLRDKTAHALVRNDALLRRQFGRLQAHLRPNGGLQERVLSPFSFFLTLGVAPVRDAFLAMPAEGDHALRF